LVGGINLYAFVDNNPTNLSDRYGLLVDGGVVSVPAAAYGAMAAGTAATIWWYHHKDQISEDLGRFWNWLWNENTEDGADSCPIPDTEPGRSTKGRTDQRVKQGDIGTANEDFDNTNPTNVKDIPNGGRTGILPDGRKINVRPNSSDGRPTIEIQNGKRRIKIRYGK
jgi:hypothetical protein